MGYGRAVENGRDTGYLVVATCDHEGCSVQIDRGLGYRCGGIRNLHDDHGCGRFFCSAHRNWDELCPACRLTQVEEDEDEDES